MEGFQNINVHHSYYKNIYTGGSKDKDAVGSTASSDSKKYKKGFSEFTLLCSKTLTWHETL